jgi:hypothetical protein
MKRAAIGVRMHSGWGALVVVSGNAGEVEVIERRHILVTDPGIPGAKQPYHHAENLGLTEAEQYLENCAAASQRMALEAVRDVICDLQTRHFRVVGSAILLASGRPLPSLLEILASHPLIHTAEGEFFRNAFRAASEHLGIAVTGLRERELEEHAKAVLGSAANRVRRKISSLGKFLGPPWTKDEKTAALAAATVLVSKTGSYPANAAVRGPTV